jgi:hypothetical protein
MADSDDQIYDCKERQQYTTEQDVMKLDSLMKFYLGNHNRVMCSSSPVSSMGTPARHPCMAFVA